jgi:hypothetical protein
MRALKQVTTMPELKIKDNMLIGKEYFDGVKNVTEKIADKTLEQLDKEGIFVFPKMICRITIDVLHFIKKSSE